MRNRTINVSDGAAEYVTARVDEVFDMPIIDCTFEVGLGTATHAPVVWQEASDVRDEQDDTSVVYVSLLVDDTFTPRSKARLWVRMTDNPEVLVRLVDGVDLTIA